MKKTNFDIYDYVHNNKFKLTTKENFGSSTPKGYNDIRKTNLSEVKISGNKFDLKENLKSSELNKGISKKSSLKETKITRKNLVNKLISEGSNPFELATLTDSELAKMYRVKFKKSLNESKYEIYHKSYTSAVNAALDWAEKQGFDYDKEETSTKIGMGPKKPSDGKTNKFSINLTKGGKEQRKQLHMQIYGMGNGKYELNCYIN